VHSIPTGGFDGLECCQEFPLVGRYGLHRRKYVLTGAIHQSRHLHPRVVEAGPLAQVGVMCRHQS
jgi:hypothetical protein